MIVPVGNDYSVLAIDCDLTWCCKFPGPTPEPAKRPAAPLIVAYLDPVVFAIRDNDLIIAGHCNTAGDPELSRLRPLASKCSAVTFVIANLHSIILLVSNNYSPLAIDCQASRRSKLTSFDSVAPERREEHAISTKYLNTLRIGFYRKNSSLAIYGHTVRIDELPMSLTTGTKCRALPVYVTNLDTIIARVGDDNLITIICSNGTRSDELPEFRPLSTKLSYEDQIDAGLGAHE